MSALEAALTAAVDNPMPEIASFAELGLPEPLVTELARQGMTAPFAIQTRTLPDALAGKDLVGRAQTGGGKTLAFGLPLLARLAEQGPTHTPGRPRALVLVPTRELARQVTDALVPLASRLRLKVTAVFGGASMGRQIDALRRGVDVVVATPGRLEDLIRQGAVSLDEVVISVLDEADHMADLGFMPAVTRLLDATPTGGQRLLFSATLDRGVEKLVHAYLVEPSLHAVASSSSPIEAMDHLVLTLSAGDKVAVAAEVAARPGRTLVFVRTKHGADRLALQLERAGVPAAAIHGNLRQSARLKALDGFAAGHPRVLVATDVAARGIHVDDVDLVVHFDPPNDHKDYLHRSGRTARAGASGTVVALVQPEQVRDVARLHRDAGVTPTAHAVHPGHEEVRRLAATGTPVPPAPVRPERPTRPARSGPPRPRQGGGRGQVQGRGQGSRGQGRGPGSRDQGRAPAPRA